MKMDSLTSMTLFSYFSPSPVFCGNARKVQLASCPSPLDPVAGIDLRLQTATVMTQFARATKFYKAEQLL